MSIEMIFWKICLMLFLASVVYEVYYRFFKYKNLSSKFPTAYGIPFFGIILKLVPVKKFLYVIGSYFEKFQSSTYCARLGLQLFIVTVDPEVIKNVLSSQESLNKSTAFYSPIDRVIPNGLITSPAFQWKLHRKLLNRFFSPDILRSFMPIFNKSMKIVIRQFEDFAASDERDLLSGIQQIVVAMSLETILGIEFYENLDENREIVNSFNYVIEKIAKDALYSSVHLSHLVRSKRYYERIAFLRNFIKKLIIAKYDKRKEDDISDAAENKPCKNKLSFLDMALTLHDKQIFQLEDVITETKTMISFETVSTTIYSTLVMLAMHSDVQEKLFEEVSCLKIEDSNILYEQIKSVPYMDMVIAEVLRLMPSIPVIGRHITEEIYIESIGKTLPKDIQVIIPIFNLHRHHGIWGSNANDFNPNNFLPDNISKRHAYSYIPFSMASRNCIGLRYAYIALRVLLIGLVGNFKFSTNFKYSDLVFIDHVSLRFEKQPLLKIQMR